MRQSEFNEFWKFAPKKPTLPILRHVHVCSEAGFARFQVNDMETVAYMTTDIPYYGAAFCADHKLLSACLKQQPDSEFIRRDPTTLILSGNTNFEIEVKAGEEFPLAPDPDTDNPTVLEFDSTWPKDVAYVLSHSEPCGPKRNFTGAILFHDGDMIGTNGRRMCIQKTGESWNGSFLIPYEVLDKIRSIKADRYRLAACEDKLVWQAGRIEGISWLSDTPFPDYEAVLPDRIDSVRLVDSEGFIKALKQLEFVAKTDAGKYMVVLKSFGNVLDLTSDSGSAKAHAQIKAEQTTVGDVHMALNFSYLMQALGYMPSTTIMRTGGSLEPLMFQDADGCRRSVIMPVRLPEESK